MIAFRIQRYLLREIAAPMVMALVIFTFVLMMGRSQKLMEMVINKGVPLGQIFHLIANLLPAFLVLTIPVALLIGVLLAFGRLSAESELVALKACGVNLSLLMRPVLVLALLSCLITAALTLYIEPTANAAFRRQAFAIASSIATIGIQPMTFNDDFSGLVLYAAEVDDKNGKMSNIFIADERPGTLPATIFATTGGIQIDQDDQSLNLRLKDGAIHRHDDNNDAYQIIQFETYGLRVNLNDSEDKGKVLNRKESELNLPDLLQARKTPQDTKEARILNAALQKRFVMASTPLIFILIGVPLGIRSQRSGRGANFALALFIFLLFYILFTLSKTLVIDLGLPALFMWLPVVVFTSAGLFLLRAAANEREINFSLRAFFLGKD
jgi:lipopolysaccharide export system permease protein